MLVPIRHTIDSAGLRRQYECVSNGLRCILCVQVWTNCRLYNAEGSDICRACKRLEKHALTAWKEHDLPRKHGCHGDPSRLHWMYSLFLLCRAVI